MHLTLFYSNFTVLVVQNPLTFSSGVDISGREYSRDRYIGSKVCRVSSVLLVYYTKYYRRFCYCMLNVFKTELCILKAVNLLLISKVVKKFKISI